MSDTILNIRLSDFTVRLKADKNINSQRLMSGIYQISTCKNSDLFIQEIYTPPPPSALKEATLLFKRRYWKVYCRPGELIYTARNLSRRLSVTAIFNRTFNHGVIYISRRGYDWIKSNLGGIITAHFLNRRKRIIFHACGVIDKKDGYLFLGHSGDGKTTMADLWVRSGSRVVNDELVEVFEKNNQIFIQGAKRWRTRKKNVFSAGKAPLKSVFIIKHGKKNQLQRLSAYEVFKSMHNRYLVAEWDKPAFSSSAEMLLRILEKTPCFLFYFVAELSCVNWIRNIKLRFTKERG